MWRLHGLPVHGRDNITPEDIHNVVHRNHPAAGPQSCYVRRTSLGNLLDEEAGARGKSKQVGHAWCNRQSGKAKPWPVDMPHTV